MVRVFWFTSYVLLCVCENILFYFWSTESTRHDYVVCDGAAVCILFPVFSLDFPRFLFHYACTQGARTANNLSPVDEAGLWENGWVRVGSSFFSFRKRKWSQIKNFPGSDNILLSTLNKSLTFSFLRKDKQVKIELRPAHLSP